MEGQWKAVLQREPRRPGDPSDLLLHKVVPNPEDPQSDVSWGWAAEHAGRPRFYVGGIDWFVGRTGASADLVSSHRQKAVQEAEASKWTRPASWQAQVQLELKADWSAISRQQFYHGVKGRPMTFAKACLFILSCELTLCDFEDSAGGNPSEGQDVYRHMAIIPACWNIDEFRKQFVDYLAENPRNIEDLVRQTDQFDSRVLFELASGCTVTFDTARKIKAYCDAAFPGRLGELRVRAGKVLGRMKAAESEYISLMRL